MDYKIIVMFIALAITSCTKNQENYSDEQSYKVMKLELQEEIINQTFSAAIKGRQDTKIIPRVDGYLTKVSVKEGDKVIKGQTLFVIDQVPYNAALSAAEANVAMNEANVASAKLAYESKQMLFKKSVVSEFDLITTQNSLKTAEAQLSQAQANLINAKNNLSYTTVKSPSNGVVGKLPYREGDYVNTILSQGLTVVADNSQMFVYFSLTESYVYNLLAKYGNIESAIDSMPRVQLRLNNNYTYPQEGDIESISGIVDENTGAVSVRAVFDNESSFLLSGSSGVVIMPTTYKNVIVIPQEATYEIQNKIYVYKVVDGVTVSNIIEVESIHNGKQYVVTSGLEPADVIIAEGVGLVREGTKIKM